MVGPVRRPAVLIDAHEYVAGTPDCDHDDAADHAPCKECGSAKDAFIHSDEAIESGATLTVTEVAAEDNAQMVEQTSKTPRRSR